MQTVPDAKAHAFRSRSPSELDAIAPRARRLQIARAMAPRRLHVVIATDFSAAADVATSELLVPLLPSNAVVDVVHVIEPAADPNLQGRTLRTSPAMLAWVTSELEKRSSRVRGLGFACDFQIRHGIPGREIAQHAIDRSAGLIAVGIRRRPSGLGVLMTWLLGHAPCAVLILSA